VSRWRRAVVRPRRRAPRPPPRWGRRDAGKTAGIGGQHFPSWRDSYTRNLLRRRVDTNLVQRLLGHSTITTMTRYMDLDDTELADAVNVVFPRSDG
jgi:site-specific recombinase XerD